MKMHSNDLDRAIYWRNPGFGPIKPNVDEEETAYATTLWMRKLN